VRAILVCLMCACAAMAQEAQLSGLILDSSQSVVPDARVSATNEQTGGKRVSVSNASGFYSLNSLSPGQYKITVEKPGFQTSVRESVTLEVSQNARLDFTLVLGATQQEVTVQADTPLVNTTDASVSTVVDRQFVENLPLNGRSFQSLIALSPGVVMTPSSESGDLGQFSVAGQRAGSNYFSIDGVSANFGAPIGGDQAQTYNGGLVAFSALGSTNSLISIDAMQEFRLESSTYAPEFGRESGAQVLLLTRSGTNRFHGTAFDYLRNSVLDANDWFADSTGLAKPGERQNDFGGVLGGPIIKDKTFFFFSYEGLRLGQAKVAIVDVPSLAARQNATPGTQAIINAFPLPNGPSTGVDLSQLAASYTDHSSLDATSLRIDHALNSKVTLFGRFNLSPSEVVERGCGGNDGSLNSICTKKVTIDTGTLGVTAILSPTITNEFRFNYSRAQSSVDFSLDNFGGAIVPPASALFPSWTNPSTGWAYAYIGTGRNVFFYEGKDDYHLNRQSNITDSLAVARGSHLLKFGFDYRRLTPTGIGDPVLSAYEWYDLTDPSASAADAVNGQPPNYQLIEQEIGPINLLFHNFSAFGQDTWKASRRLTLTYGVRWDYNPPPTEPSGQKMYAISQITNFATATLLPLGSPLWHADWKNFAPRLGVSYLLRQDPERPTVLRVGFGEFYDIGTSSAGYLADGRFPYGLSTTVCNFGSGPACNSSAPYNGPQPPLVFTQPYSEMRAFDPHLKLPYSLEWSVALEQTLTHNQTFKVTYIGSASRRLLRDEYVVDPNPIFSALRVTTNGSFANYNALQLQFQRRLSHGLQALVSYSWSHSLDLSSSDNTDPTIGGLIPTSLYNVKQDYGNSTFDVRQSLSAALTYNIPVPNVRSSLARSVLRGWSLDSITFARTGTPFNVFYQPATPGAFGAPGIGGYQLRPDQVAGQPVWIHDSNAPGGKELNAAAFSIPAVVGQGSEGRNSIRGFPLLQMDLALRRQFSITEHFNLLFRVDAFNIINHPNFGNPLNSMGTCVAGVQCTPVYGWGTSQAMLNQALGASDLFGGGFSSLYQIGGPRSLQLSMKVQF
jgi:hypothetical protein